MAIITIQDGKHRAKLFSVAIKQAKSGRPFAQFNWQFTDGSNRRIYSISSPTRRDGSRNDKGIDLMKQWAPGWDGNDIRWFEQNLDTLRETEVDLLIKNKPWFKDPSQIGPQVIGIYPVAKGGLAEKPRRETTPAKHPLQTPIVATPNMIDIFNAFKSATEGMDSVVRDKLWLDTVHSAVPGKDQDLFTDEDWQTVIDAFNRGK